MGIAFGGAVAIVAMVYLGAGHGEKLNVALRATARWSFLLVLAGIGRQRFSDAVWTAVQSPGATRA